MNQAARQNERQGGGWMTTYTGKRYHPARLRPEDVDIEDISQALGNLCRFNGFCDPFYSVAEHSVILSRIVPPALALQALLHDACEAYSGIGDVLPTAKQMLPEIRQIEEAITEVVATAFDLHWPFPMIISEMDKALAKAEAKVVHPQALHYWERQNLIPIPEPDIGPLAPEDAEVAFLARYHQLAAQEEAA